MGRGGGACGQTPHPTTHSASHPSRNPIPPRSLTEAAEKTKIELSSLTQTSINLPFITATADGPKHIDQSITRAKFEEMCSDLLDRCVCASGVGLRASGVCVGC